MRFNFLILILPVMLTTIFRCVFSGNQCNPWNDGRSSVFARGKTGGAEDVHRGIHGLTDFLASSATQQTATPKQSYKFVKPPYAVVRLVTLLKAVKYRSKPASEIRKNARSAPGRPLVFMDSDHSFVTPAALIVRKVTQKS